VLCLLCLSAVGRAQGAAARQQRFPSPEAGVQALLEAVQKHDTAALVQILGPEARAFLQTGDLVSDQASRVRFVQEYETAHTLWGL
jgi:hypothetical protein